MTNLSTLFGRSSEPERESEAESEKLLELYWNRAELKKRFAELRAERYRLQDLVKQKDGQVARLHQQLAHIESLLLDPEWAYNVVAHFQLRRVNRRCQNRLAKFAEELKQQRERKQHGQLVADWHEQRDLEASAIESEIGKQRVQLQLLEDRLQAERQRMAACGTVRKLFLKRSLQASLNEIVARIEEVSSEERSLLRRLEDVQNREPPDSQGLNVATKRMINFMILAFAQQLYLHFAPDGLAKLAKDAGDKSPGAVNYGGKAGSEEILELAARRLAALDRAADFAGVVRDRARLIAQKAIFRGNEDAVPIASTVALVLDFDASGKVTGQQANLLGENYWNVANVVSR